MKLSGIYQIQSKIKPERCYIGSAIHISNRWTKHLSELRLNRHHSRKLQLHYNKYGESDLQFSVLLGCEKEDLLGDASRRIWELKKIKKQIDNQEASICN